MNTFTHTCVVILLLVWFGSTFAQGDFQETLEEVSTDVGTLTPEPEVPVNIKVRLNPMPRALEYTREYHGRTIIVNTPTNIALDGAKDTVRYERSEVKLKVPIYLKRTTQIIIGGRYASDRFFFDGGASYPIYSYMHRHKVSIKTITLYVNKFFKHHYFLNTRSEFGLFGESSELEVKRVYRFSQSLLLGRHRSQDLAYGIGIYMSYQYQRQSIYPVIYYQMNFTEKLGVATIFPANAYLRYAPDDKTFLQLGYEVNAFSYALRYTIDTSPELSGADFRRSAVRPRLAIDREVYDFIWVGFAVGWCKTVKADIQKRDQSGRRRLSDLSYGDPWFASASVFVTIPRKYRKKLP